MTEPARYRILVVDDYPDAAESVSSFLALMGHTCSTAHLGEAGLALAEECQPQVAILDIGLPDLSGYEVARGLRKSFGPALFLVALTGWGQEEDRARAAAAGFDKHMLKPADAAMLREIIRLADAHFLARAAPG